MHHAKELARNLLAQEPGRENRHAIAAGIPNLSHTAPNRKAPDPIAVTSGSEMARLRLLYLRRFHGLTEAQAVAIAALIWGAFC